jgi:O-antigen/teichoic acid export membrane protein
VATITGRGRVKFGASLAGLLFFLAAAWVLIPLYGAAGAAAALSLAIAADVAVLSLALRADFLTDWAALWPGAALGAASLVLLFWFG